MIHNSGYDNIKDKLPEETEDQYFEQHKPKPKQFKSNNVTYPTKLPPPPKAPGSDKTTKTGNPSN